MDNNENSKFLLGRRIRTAACKLLQVKEHNIKNFHDVNVEINIDEIGRNYIQISGKCEYEDKDKITQICNIKLGKLYIDSFKYYRNYMGFMTDDLILEMWIE